MSKYILLLNWTEQGIKAIKNSGDRFDKAKDVAKQSGCTIEAVYMTFGPHDLVVIADAKDDEAIALFNLRVTSLGNVRGVTMRAFAEADYKHITASV